MSIEIRINKDIGSYEAKFLGPFTLRQTICVGIAVPIGWGFYFGFSPYIGTDLAGFLVFIPAAAAAMFGWMKPFGMPTERFLRSVGVSLLAPAVRKYRIANLHEQAIREWQEEKQAEPPKRKKYKVSRKAVK